FKSHIDIIITSPKEVNMPYWRLFYHIVWGTKNRLSLIESVWEAELHGYIWGKATALECIPHAINGMSDHLHVVISIPPKLSIATTIGKLKGSSSHYVNERYMDSAFAWQAEYGILSFSERSLSRVVDYVKNQKKHHADDTLNMAMENFGISSDNEKTL